MQKPDDHEAKMARADLFKLAQYSFKLFKMIGDNQELEGWVQAKITKAADYIASVYHYMEYEMKVNEYGDAIENADMYSESVRRAFQQKLVEAKEMAKKAKAKAEKAEKALDEEAPLTPAQGQALMKSKDPNAFNKMKGIKTPAKTTPAVSDPEGVPAKPGAVKEAAKAKKDYDGDGKVESPKDEVWGSRAKAAAKSGKPFKEEADRKPAKKSEREVELPSGAKVKATKVQGWQSQKADKDGNKERTDPYKAEAAKPDFLDMDKDGNKKEPMKKAVADKKVKEAAGKCNHTPKDKSCPVHGLKECGSMYEASHQEKTTMKHVKDPTPGEKKAAKDIKPGIAGYKDRVAMLKSAEKDGRLKA